MKLFNIFNTKKLKVGSDYIPVTDNTKLVQDPPDPNFRRNGY